MASKILRPDRGAACTPINWLHVHAPRKHDPAGIAVPVRPQAETEDQEQQLKRRIQDLEQLLELKVKEAHEAGFRAGEASSRAQAMDEVQNMLGRLSETIQEVATVKTRLRKEAEADLVQLSIAVARRILHRELSVDPSALQGIAAVALSKLQSQDACTVRVNPQHATVLQGNLDRLGTSQNIEIVPDAGVELGRLVFESARGSLDASIETQLEEIERGLSDKLRRLP